jgi:peroxiredoxin
MKGLFTSRNLVLLGTLALFLGLHVYLKHKFSPDVTSKTSMEGTTVKNFRLTSIEGKEIDLEATARSGRMTIINFWETWCGPCKIEMAELQRLFSRHHPSGLEIIAVYQTSSDESVRQMVGKSSLTFPIAKDPACKLCKIYKVEAVPTTVVLDKDLKVIRSRRGLDVGLREFVEGAFAGRE